MSVKAIRNHVIFQFELKRIRTTSHGRERTQFQEETDWGFDIGATTQEYDKSSKEPQWAKVIEVGHEVTDVKIGDRILIEPLKWTIGIEVDGKDFWRTDESCILLIDDAPK